MLFAKNKAAVAFSTEGNWSYYIAIVCYVGFVTLVESVSIIGEDDELVYRKVLLWVLL